MMDLIVNGLDADVTGNIATEQAKESDKQLGTGGNIATVGVTNL